ncbi:hypothetical protein, partial [Streptomyces sp. ID01-9D]|uniref:hypothetical protein n=1 Tax=Streptomyces sp. ID01-9D TaxID=3028659 RepID=UPI0029C3247A
MGIAFLRASISDGQTPVGVVSTTGVVRFTDCGLLFVNLERAYAPAQPDHRTSLAVEFGQPERQLGR